MSHFTNLTTEIRDLEACKKALENMGLQLQEYGECRYYYGVKEMKLTKFGVSVALISAVAYFAGYVGIVPIVLLFIFALYIEYNALYIAKSAFNV